MKQTCAEMLLLKFPVVPMCLMDMSCKHFWYPAIIARVIIFLPMNSWLLHPKSTYSFVNIPHNLNPPGHQKSPINVTPVRPSRNTSTFKLNLWSMFDGINDNFPRTNVSFDGWHRSVQSGMGSWHPYFCKFLSYLLWKAAIQDIRRAAGRAVNHKEEIPLYLDEAFNSCMRFWSSCWF
jgi:hypothetical protein